MMFQNDDEKEIRDALTETTAQVISKDLKGMKSSGRHTRWIWELLQNARDVSIDTDNYLVAEVRYNGENLVFLHNGRGFTRKEIIRLIFHGSTKVEDERTIGQYGSGFLTTHLLSWEIDVSGQRADDGKWFNFRLVRKPEPIEALRDSMYQAWQEYNSSVTEYRPESLPAPFTTQFVYPIRGQEAEQAVEAGKETLKQCAPYVVISNPQFSRINIDFPSEKMCFEAKRPESDPSSVQQITVTEDTNGNSKDRQYLLTKGDMETSVIVPLELEDEGLVCQSVEKIPRLFLGFPLVGTEAFSFPAVINSFKFTPTENRNGVYLGKNDDSENNTNQAVLEEACTLLARLLQHSASTAWHHTHQWIEIPTIQANDWVDAEWLKKWVKNKLMSAIYDTPVVLNETSNAILMREAILPVAGSDEGIEDLWDLLEVWKEYSEKLPRRVEAIGWCKTIKNWANILGEETTEYRAGIDGSQLASQMVEKTKNAKGWGRLEYLQDKLRANVSGVEWLNQLYEFLKNNKFDHVIRALPFILDQEGFLDSLSKLHRDLGIDDELKEIAEWLEWRIRQELRDLRLPSLAQEEGPGDMKSDDIVSQLLGKLSNRANENPDAAFKQASVSFFGWIVSQEAFPLLSNFPVFAVDGKSALELSSADNRTPPLAPVRSWQKDLQPFADLFPPERILDNAFFEKVPDQEVWKHLNDLGIVRTDMIISRETTNLNALSLELQGGNEAHEATAPFSVTDFVERESIMERVRNRTERGRLFWQFITEYLVKAGSQFLETQTIECKSCGGAHNCYPAAWLESVRNNQWIRQGDSRFTPDAKSLASLLRGSDWKLSVMDENHALVEFLNAIRLTPSELRFEFIMNDKERDTVIQKVTDVHQAVGGNWELIEAIAERVQNDEKASENIVRILEAPEDELDQVVEELAERQEQQQRVTENQDLGLQVERWVGESLKDEGFDVKPVHTGADFKIIDSDLITLGVTQGTRKWWIEVKSTKTESVKMSSKQTQKALKKEEEFLLCVVPIPEKTDPNLEVVRQNMRFIKNISKKFGDRVTEFCEHIGEQEVIQANQDDIYTGVELKGEVGKAETRVQQSVWESDEAFPLEKLKEKLR